MKVIAVTLLACTCLVSLQYAAAIGDADLDGWNYRHPDDWDLYYNITTCNGSRTDARQSPINLAASIVSIVTDQSDLTYHDAICDVEEFTADTHAWQWTINEEGSEPTCQQYVTYGFPDTGEIVDWTIEEVVVHSPSEHMIGGSQYDGELQLVHRYHPNSDEVDYSDTSADRLLIISVFIEANEMLKENPSLEKYWLPLEMISDSERSSGRRLQASTGQKLRGGRRLPDVGTGVANTHSRIKATGATSGSDGDYTSVKAHTYADFVPEGSYYTYQGSQTTPECLEIVTWIVMTNPIQVSAAQLYNLRSGVQHSTNSKAGTDGGFNRPTQQLHRRNVTYVSI